MRAKAGRPKFALMTSKKEPAEKAFYPRTKAQAGQGGATAQTTFKLLYLRGNDVFSSIKQPSKGCF
ncbi:MAG: hypothetical protein CMH56_13985 [Myxococcales bacterium]|nr:hypothetical protein [Myxococcales bacterium]|tara:strand:- start:1244 stop:1441 length:198 start_codon:yes stop_codon:yes gene_type:complete